MSVELLDTTRFHGFRVRRQIAGKTYQEYFSLKENGKRLRGARRAEVKARAEERDAVLEKQQAKAKAEAAKTALFDKNGKVRGILFRMKTEKSGTRTPVFQIGIMSAKAGKIVNTTVSINLHGLEGAWEKAVEFYIDHKKISKRSQIYKQLLAAQPSKAQLDAMKRKRKSAPKAKVATKAASKAAPKKVAAKKVAAKKAAPKKAAKKVAKVAAKKVATKKVAKQASKKADKKVSASAKKAAAPKAAAKTAVKKKAKSKKK